jgi:L-ascorbate metabolism protein UlaG (beta-lactamase superfamily)
MKFTYYGHSCFEVSLGGKTLLFDPFITPNELAAGRVDIGTLKPDFILLSHGHGDHIADCTRIAGSSGAKVIANYEIHEWLNGQGIANTHPMNTGGRRDFGSFWVKCVNAAHSSSLPDGTYGGNPMGFILGGPEGNFYYSGDTALTRDMELVPRWAKLNFAVLPIGDNFTMDAADATECARMIQCKTAVGVHYDTFGYIKIDHQKAIGVFKDAGYDLKLPAIGECISIG